MACALPGLSLLSKKTEDQRFAKPLDEFSDLILLDQDDLELVDVNRLFSDFRFSWVNIIEFMEIKNIHGEESEIYKKWKALDNEHYSDFFEYRFVEQLRNFIHIDIQSLECMILPTLILGNDHSGCDSFFKRSAN